MAEETEQPQTEQESADESTSTPQITGGETSEEQATADQVRALQDALDRAQADDDSTSSGQPVRVDNFSRRSDNDALEGHFVRIVKGEHEGRVGAFVKVAEYRRDGYPKSIIFRSRDAEDELFTVPYASVRPAGDYHGGR